MAKLFVNKSNLTIITTKYILNAALCDEKAELHVECVPGKGLNTLKNNDDSLQEDDLIIECCNYSPCGNVFATCYNKTLIVWDVRKWSVLGTCNINRKAVSLQFFATRKIIVIAGKSGDVSFFAYSTNGVERLNEYILGHNSMLLDILISFDDKFIVTCDRDEKIRVSKFPNVYNIHTFCLGHKSFITSIKFLPSDPRILISVAGDGMICFWDYLLGIELTSFAYENDKIKEDSSKHNELKETCNQKLNNFAITKMDCIMNSDGTSMIAFLLYKIPQINVLNVKGSLESAIEVNVSKVIDLTVVPWDIVLLENRLFCILPEADILLKIWTNKQDNFEEETTPFSNTLRQCLKEKWVFFESCHKKDELIPVLFKREFDNVLEYHIKKKARLSS